MNPWLCAHCSTASQNVTTMGSAPEHIYTSNLHPHQIIDLFKTRPITHFRQEKNKLCDVGIAEVAPVLFTDTLQHLDLSWNEIHKKGAQIIADSLSRCTSLTYLDLSYNNMGVDAALAILRALLNSNVPLRTLNMELVYTQHKSNEAVLLHSELISRKNLICDYIESAYDDDVAQQLFLTLKTNTSLEELHLEYGPAQADLVEDCFSQNTSIVRGSGYSIGRYIMINQICKKLGANATERKSIPKQMTKREDIEALLTEMIGKGEEAWNAGKMVFLGNGGAGKTSLLNAIRLRSAGEMSTGSCLAMESTVGIDHSIISLKCGELSVWDFAGETDMSQFFMSHELVVYVVCYDLSLGISDQCSQIAYWLNYLQSTITSRQRSSTSKWTVLIVGTKLDKCVTFQARDSLISSWQAQWPALPIHDRHFCVSSGSLACVEELLHALEGTFAAIFANHTVSIPISYKTVLRSLQAIPDSTSIRPLSELFLHHSCGLSPDNFAQAVKYLHIIGRVVLLKGDIICTSLVRIPKVASKFRFPEEVRMKLPGTKEIAMLAAKQVGTVLTIKNDPKRLNEEITLLEGIGLCFAITDSTRKFLFPSLALKMQQMKFCIANETHPHLAAMRFRAPEDTIFVPSFFFEFVVALFSKFNISQSELLAMHSNWVSVSCGGVFVGELLVAIEENGRDIVALMRAINPDLSLVSAVFFQLVKTHAYETSTQEFLCPTCVDLSYFQAKFPHDDVGIIDQDDTRRRAIAFCNPRRHKLESIKYMEPQTLNTALCWNHYASRHDLFLSYRVATEGTKSKCSSTEGKYGLVEVIYNKLSTTKRNNTPVLVFWDKKCLPYGQDWEHAFLHGITSSSAILLLVSLKAIEGMKKAAHQQDNFYTYECAVLQNAISGKPVLPLYAAEMTEHGTFAKFDYAKAGQMLVDAPHKREPYAQRIIDELSQSLPDPSKKDLLVGTIKRTVEKVLKMKGTHLYSRGEDEQELNVVVGEVVNIFPYIAVAKI